MKESRFIELLNLYIDREIGQQELALLEEQITRNPEHQLRFQQYCRMHKGCLELAVNFQSSQESGVRVRTAWLSRADRAWRPWRNASVYAAGALVAACIALVLVLTKDPVELGGLNDSVLNPTGTFTAGSDSFSGNPQFISDAQQRLELQPVLASGALSGLNASVGSESVFASANQTQFDWMKEVQPGSNRLAVPVEEFVFETNKTLQTDYRMFKDGRSFQGAVEMTAFQFQR